jgi:TRAP-type mannitol/chloroaromatic compound transport system permease large subunit
MPLFVPAAQALNIDMVWFGVVMAIHCWMTDVGQVACYTNQIAY